MATKQKKKRQGNDPVADKLGSVAGELDSIKRLLILQLITSGVQATNIASTLKVSKSAVSALVPARKVKKPKTKR